MREYLLLSACDASEMSRPDPSLLDDQTLLELLISECPQFPTPVNGEEIKSIQKWTFVKFRPDTTVKEIHFPFPPHFFKRGSRHSPKDKQPKQKKQAVGNMDLRWIPSSVERFSVIGHNVGGTIDTSALPRALTEMLVSGNMFGGTFDVAGLPRDMTKAGISTNDFEGSLDLTTLPFRMGYFAAAENRFSGTLNLTRLPESLQSLNLSKNNFSGEIKVVALSSDFLLLKVDKCFKDRIFSAKGPYQHEAIQFSE